MDTGNIGEALVALAIFGAVPVLFIVVPACLYYFLFRSTDRLWREGVRVEAVVTRVTPQHMDPTLVSFRFTKPGSSRLVERRQEWMNPSPLPAIGDTVTVIYRPGWWWYGVMLEANLRVAPRV